MLKIVFIIMLIVPLIYSQEVIINYPEKVYVGEEFEITIELSNFSEGIYDTKFDIRNGSKNIAKRFWENEWKSTHYWMYNALNESEKKKTFKLMISEPYIGEVLFFIRIKNNVEEFIFNNSLEIETKKEEMEERGSRKEALDIDLKWDENEIVNGEEFEISIKINKISDNKDVKVYIDNGKIISDRYYEEWKSGMFYANDFLDTLDRKMKIRIREEHRNFSGEAEIVFKLRNGFEHREKIEIIPYNEKSNTNDGNINSSNKSIGVNETKTIINETIKLGYDYELKPWDVKTNPVYESKTEKMRKYSVFAFALFCVLLVILIIWRKM
ncbi:hypothetical protein J4221_02900 [Candidatus Pacearchaeota archaeon]|nr:hypothetical protein [Candidatus Pacearchaeota archaeon]